jgi:hypothetical protein
MRSIGAENFEIDSIGWTKNRFSRVLGRKPLSVQSELDSAQRLGEQLEQLVVQRGECPDDDRNILLMAYWTLLFDFYKAILSLIPNGPCGSAFALVRPAMEALVRAPAVKGSDEDIKGLRQDDYRTSFTTIGPWIDREFGAGDLFTNFLGHARDALHRFTYAGVSQLGRRFDGHNLVPTYDDDEIIEVIRVTTSAVWMATNLVTKHLGFAAEVAKADQLYLEWGKH